MIGRRDENPEPSKRVDAMDGGRMRLVRIAVRAALAVILVAAVLVALPWAGVIYQRTMPRPLERRLILGFLHLARWSYALVLVMAPLGAALSFVALVRFRARRRPWHHWARLFLVCGSFSFMILPSEYLAGRWLRHQQRIPRLPEWVETQPTDQDGAGSLSLVVIGGSTAEGQPYHPRVSPGLLVATLLEPLLDGRRVDLDIRATGGICLEQAILTLTTLQRKPDVLLICSGHNEFQARYGWSRNVRHYTDEGELPGHSRVGARLSRISSVSAMIESSIDRNALDRPPPPRITRQLVDRPAFTRDEYAFLLKDYSRRLDELLRYCRRVGIVPIVVVPASNLADYPPARSYLAPEVTAEQRAAFEAAFEAARRREDTEPVLAEQAFRRLVAEHPSFAELHYRLGRLLLRDGRHEEAGEHLRLARDLDGMPMRCPSDFEAACREIARRHDAILVDGPKIVAALDPRGIPGDALFHDAHHPTLPAYLALAETVVRELAGRGLLGLVADALPEAPGAEALAGQLGVDAEWWATVCERSASFYARTAYMRYDPSEHLRMAELYSTAAELLRGGASLEEMDLASLRLESAAGWETPPPGVPDGG